MQADDDKADVSEAERALMASAFPFHLPSVHCFLSLRLPRSGWRTMMRPNCKIMKTDGDMNGNRKRRSCEY
jgi:hypothetical protein